MQHKSVLMIHGAGGGGWEWSAWARVFQAADCEVHAPDLAPLACGLAATRFQDYAAQVRHWCHAARPQILIGASLGGLLALHGQAAAPAAALVLVNPMPPAGFGSVGADASLPGPIVPWRRRATLASTARALPDADPSTWQFAWRRWRDESTTVIEEARAGIGTALPSTPVLILAGDADRDIPVATSLALARHLHADAIVLAGASHVGPLLGSNAAGIAEQALAWWRLGS